LVTIYYPSAQKTTAQIERTIISPVTNFPVSVPHERSINILVTPETTTVTETIKQDDEKITLS
jgi:hypothetical protein